MSETQERTQRPHVIHRKMRELMQLAPLRCGRRLPCSALAPVRLPRSALAPVHVRSSFS